jgi:hypothetical protein
LGRGKERSVKKKEKIRKRRGESWACVREKKEKRKRKKLELGMCARERRRRSNPV